jgi:hypothetical protein
VATLRSPTLMHVLIEVESGRTDLDHVERTLADAGLTRVSTVRHGASETYNWLYERLDTSQQESMRHQANATAVSPAYVD